MRKPLWLFAFALVLIGAGVAALAMKRGSEPRAPASPPQPQAQLKLEDVRYSSTRQDRKEWELVARQVQYFQEEGVARLDQVRLTFYGQDGKQYQVTGGYAWIEPDSSDVEVAGGVVGRSSDGYVFRTDMVTYLAAGRQIVADGPVELEGPRLSVRGEGLVMDLGAAHLEVEGRVTTVLKDAGDLIRR